MSGWRLAQRVPAPAGHVEGLPRLGVGNLDRQRHGAHGPEGGGHPIGVRGHRWRVQHRDLDLVLRSRQREEGTD